MELLPLAPECGVEISGIQLADAEGEALEKIKQAIFENGVAVFRDQDFSPAEHLAFAKRWGGIDINNFFPLLDDFPEIATVHKKPGHVTNIGGAWHTDHSYDQVPAMGSILVARTLPPEGGDTLFAHMGAAYDALPDDLKQEIDGLQAYHSADHIYNEGGVLAASDLGDELRGRDVKTGATHPMVIRHPCTGRKLLYVNVAHTIQIVGQSRKESMPLLKRIYRAALTDTNQCRVKWQPGTVVIWDNRTSWHFALNDYHGHERKMDRITLTGEPVAA